MAKPHTDLLKQFGLNRNPFTDRTAEKTGLDDLSLYIRSDLQGFKPSSETYVFFGRRGSGKTTIRLQVGWGTAAGGLGSVATCFPCMCSFVVQGFSRCRATVGYPLPGR